MKKTQTATPRGSYLTPESVILKLDAVTCILEGSVNMATEQVDKLDDFNEWETLI